MWKLQTETNSAPVEMRKAFMTTVCRLMDTDEQVVMLEADLGAASGSCSLVGKKHPDRFINVGIAEANMVGVAAGLSMLGFVPFLHSFAPFLSRRSADQIYLEGAYAGTTMNLYASDPGVCTAQNGGTHSTYEDIACMRAIPQVEVYHPADAAMMSWLVKEVAGRKGVHYIRANRKACPGIYADSSTFEIGKGNILRRGETVLLVSMGDTLSEALEAADALAEQGVSVEVVDMFSLKPFDAALLMQELRGKKLVVTLENHSIYGGLGGIVAELMAEAGVGIPLRRVGVNDQFGQVGDVKFLKETYGLTAAHTMDVIKLALQ